MLDCEFLKVIFKFLVFRLGFVFLELHRSVLKHLQFSIGFCLLDLLLEMSRFAFCVKLVDLYLLSKQA